MSVKVRPQVKGMDRVKLVSFRLNESERDELGRLAAAEGLSLSDYLREHLIRDQAGRIERPKAATDET